MSIYKGLEKVMVIGSGPIIIGQAAEFDYSGTQACKILREHGLKVILVNSNPATIMTDKEMADSVYIEPLTVEFLEKIIAKERPDGVLVGMGGQVALNLALELWKAGILDKYNTKLLGTNIDAIEKSEDREKFKLMMESIGEPVIDGRIASSLQEAFSQADEIGYPIVVRPAYTLGGTGGGIAENREELEKIVPLGLSYSAVGQVLIEKSVKGWKEIEYEMIRDNKGNCITVCNMENIDPVGIHTGDSIVIAPSQTLSDKEYQMLRNASIKIVTSLGIKGGCNVQLALNPYSFEYRVIEVNPRVSRSSALASKATGYPIAKVAAQIAIGLNLDEIPNDVTGKTLACFEPTLDYCVIKIPKWPFDKFETGNRTLGTKMMATGEIMAIGNSFESALLKGVRSLEIGVYSLEIEKAAAFSDDEVIQKILKSDDERLFFLAELLRRGYKTEYLWEMTEIDRFYLEKIHGIVKIEEGLKKKHLSEINAEELLYLKKKGFADLAIASFTKSKEIDVFEKRKSLGVMPVFKMVDTCGGEFEAQSPYYYSTYDPYDEVVVSDRKKVIVIGSGPIRIGQGIEFDYCSVHGVISLKKMGIESIIINNNPETVSTDFDTSDKLYFEPLTQEDVMNIVLKEKPDGVILQYGGQTAIKLAEHMEKMGVKILGSGYDSIDRSEDREKFEAVLEKLDIARPLGKGVMTVEEGLEFTKVCGFPVLIRPSYVLGGMGMEIAYDESECAECLENAFRKDKKNPVLIDKYLNGKEIEVDAIGDGTDILIPGIMEHLERAGVHSGDSISVYPAFSISDEIKNKIIKNTKKLAMELNVIGLVNVQYVVYQDEVYVIEVNPRASRTVPYISKVTGIPMIRLATEIMMGAKLKDLGFGTGLYKTSGYYAVKVPVFSMEKLPQTEIALGPEMKSTGEALGLEKDLYKAIYKGLVGSRLELGSIGRVLVSISDNYKDEFEPIAFKMKKLGFEFYATEGTGKYLGKLGIEHKHVAKIGEGETNVLSLIRNEKLTLVINIPSKGRNSLTEGFHIRRTSIENRVPCMTSLDTLNYVLDIWERDISYKDVEVYDITKI
jgi:carbamoyl-phosphate synthase large subunit